MSETYLSPEAYERLQRELEELRTEGRRRIAAVIEQARAHGDIRENAEYHAAKEEQSKMEARIRQLEELLERARVAPAAEGDVVAPGTVVTLDIDGVEETYLVGSREDRDAGYEVLSPSSPLGRAVLGARAGDTVEADAPAGRLRVTVRAVRAAR